MNKENLRRWRLILGAEKADGTGYQLEGLDKEKDQALGAIYEYQRKDKFDYGNQEGQSRQGGSEKSNPGIARWLGDIRKYFPKSVVDILQGDAMKLQHFEIK